MTTLTKSQLIEFRDKLVRAKAIAASNDFLCYAILDAFWKTGLPYCCEYTDARDTPENPHVPWNIWDWYMIPSHTPEQRSAMWDNSIAHANKLIEECEG